MAITFGQTGAPAQDTVNLDALLSLSLHNYNSTMVDNISSANPFYYEIKTKSKPKSGGVSVKQNLMYALSEPQPYDGYDEITILPTDGITQATFEWRQLADTVVISGREERQNKEGLEDLLDAKIQQVEMGFIEYWNKRFLQGDNSGVKVPHTNSANGAQFIEPIAKVVQYDPTASEEFGGINQNTHSWWRNVTANFTSVTTEKGFLQNMDTVYNNCSKGPGGPPDLILVDQLTYELWRSAYYTVYRRTAEGDDNYPFPNIKFNKSRVVWDDKMIDVANGTLTPTTGKGSAFFLNTKFFFPYHIGDRNFQSSEFKTLLPKQDAKASVVMWMGTIACSNRRKQGVVGNIARSLS